MNKKGKNFSEKSESSLHRQRSLRNFRAIVMTEKLVFDKIYEKIDVSRSHFGTHGYAISLFVIVATE